MISLKGRRILITGGGKRLGRVLRARLAESGADVIVHSHSGSAEGIVGDLSTEAGCVKLISDAGPLDFLVNNAAVYPEDTFEDMSRFEEFAAVNAMAPLYLTREFAKRCKSGAVVNILDYRHLGEDSRHLSYLASKDLCREFTLLCARELAPNIRVNGVAPGPLVLPEDDFNARYADLAPLKRCANGDDVADAVIYLLTAESVTGEIIRVDGGRHLGHHSR